MEGEAWVSLGGLGRVPETDRFWDLDLDTSGKALGHDLVTIEKGGPSFAEPAEEKEPADGGWAPQCDLRVPAQDPRHQATYVATISRIRRAAEALLDEQFLLAHRLHQGTPYACGERPIARPLTGPTRITWKRVHLSRLQIWPPVQRAGRRTRITPGSA
jgi:hypothetical protein